MRTNLIVIFSIFVLTFMMMINCKPRRTAYDTSGDGADTDAAKIESIDAAEAYSQQIGIHVLSHPLYDKVGEIWSDVFNRVDRAGYFIRLKSLLFYLKEL